MTSASATASALQPFTYNQLVTSAAQLIGEYADESRTERNGQRPKRAIPIIQWVCSRFLGQKPVVSKEQLVSAGKLALSDQWSRELEAEKSLAPWVEKQIFRVGNAADQPFQNAVHVILVDIGKIDWPWLQGLGEKLLAKGEYVTIERERYASPFVKAFLGNTFGPLGSQARWIPITLECCGLKRTTTFHTIKLCLEEDELYLHRDTTGRPFLENALYLKKLPSYRIGHHEGLHIEQVLTGKTTGYLADVPKTFRWTNGLEMMTIRGSGKNAKGEPLEEAMQSENAFARAAGEMERIAHCGVPDISSLPKNEQLLKALQLGANGTVDELLREALYHACYIDMINREPHKKARVEKMLAESNYLDIRTVSLEELNRAYDSQIDLPFTDNEEDSDLQKLMMQGKRDAYRSIRSARTVYVGICEQNKNSAVWKTWQKVIVLGLAVVTGILLNSLTRLQSEK